MLKELTELPIMECGKEDLNTMMEPQKFMLHQLVNFYLKWLDIFLIH